jgi:Na+-translocating ferredoxin:NAD+ oxidoreductase RnfD subunit
MNVTRNHLRIKTLETICVLALFSLVLFIVTQWTFFCYASLALLTTALFLKTAAEKISQGWLKFAGVLGSLNNKILLALLFYLLLTPIALLYRFFNKDPLKLDLKATGSYYSERDHTYDSDDLTKMW